MLSGAAVVRAGLRARHTFGRDRVSANVTDGQLAMLDRMGIRYELVPLRTLAVDGVAKSRSSRSLNRVVPSTQVPYGVKMIYGNPVLATAGIGGGNGITVAVLDTGSIIHNDFYRADGTFIRTGCVDFSQPKSPQVENTCTDGHGHGTHVTGTIAAAGGKDGLGIFGIAPGANIFSYKVLTDRGFHGNHGLGAQKIKAELLMLPVVTDLLFPPEASQALVNAVTLQGGNAEVVPIHSPNGHLAGLDECNRLAEPIARFLSRDELH